MAVVACVLINTPLGQAEAPSSSSPLTAEQRETNFRKRWAEASALQDRGLYVEAASRYRDIVAAFPRSQRAALRIAICEERAGFLDNATSSYDAAIAMDPFGSWAEVGLFFHARCCLDADCGSTARDAIRKLRQRFPDSAYLARASVIESQLDRRPSGEADADLQSELSAGAQFDEIVRNTDRLNARQRILALRLLVEAFPQTATALRARETLGHLLIRESEPDEAITVFEDLLSSLEVDAAQSRIALTAKTRLAALYHWRGRKQDAFDIYRDLSASSADSAIRSNAALQAAGIHMEFNVADHLAATDTEMEDVLDGAASRAGASLASPSRRQILWEETRRLCRVVENQRDGKTGDKVRARLIVIESYHWQHRTTEAFDAAVAFVAMYEGVLTEAAAPRYRQELATAHQIAGECLQRLGQHEEALVHYYWIVGEFGEEELWAGLANLQRTYTRIYEALRLSNAPEDEVAAAADFVLDRWPDSEYGEMVRWATGR